MDKKEWIKNFSKSWDWGNHWKDGNYIINSVQSRHRDFYELCSYKSPSWNDWKNNKIEW